MGLADFLDEEEDLAPKKPVGVAASVYASLMQNRTLATEYVKPVMPLDRKNPRTFLRASGLGYLCTRMETLRIKHNASLVDNETPADLWARSLGHAHHEMMQRDVAPSVVGHRMLGWWRDEKGEILKGYDAPGRPKLFPRPADGKWTYEEVFAFDSDIGIGGHPDAVVDWTGSGLPEALVPDGYELQEYKTRGGANEVTAASRWAQVDPAQGGRPDFEHVVQTNIYLMLLGLQWGRIIYIKKGASDPDGAFVEWRVRRDDTMLAGVKNVIAQHWKAVDLAIEEAVVHPTGPCNDFYTGRARTCPMRYECFGRTWKKKREDVVFGDPA